MNEQIVVGSVVIGVGFIVDVEFNGMEGQVVKDWGDQEVIDKTDPPETVSMQCFDVKWQNGETDLIKRVNLRLKKPDDQGEKDILALFSKRGTKYSFEHYEEIKTEMENERVKEVEEIE